MKTRTYLPFASAVWLIAASATLCASPTAYTLTPIHWDSYSLDANAFNDSAQIVGIVNGVGHAFLYDDGTASLLDPFGSAFSAGYDINDLGAITGRALLPASGVYHGFLSSEGVITDIGTLGGTNSMGLGINNAGMITGQASTSTEEAHAFVYSGGVLTDLFPLDGWESSGEAINESGDVAGYFIIPGTAERRPCLFTGGSLLDLGALASGPGDAHDLNDLGQVVGQVSSANGFFSAFLYDQGVLQELGTFGGLRSIANAINNSGNVVGYAEVAAGAGDGRRAFLYSEGSMYDLNNLLAEDYGWTLHIAEDINECGQILCVASTQSATVWSPVVLTPVGSSAGAVPETSTWGLFGAMALALAVLFQRRTVR